MEARWQTEFLSDGWRCFARDVVCARRTMNASQLIDQTRTPCFKNVLMPRCFKMVNFPIQTTHPKCAYEEGLGRQGHTRTHTTASPFRARDGARARHFCRAECRALRHGCPSVAAAGYYLDLLALLPSRLQKGLFAQCSVELGHRALLCRQIRRSRLPRSIARRWPLAPS